MASIGNYNISQSNSSVPFTEATATLAALTNSVTAMLDDILVGYASAQLMVGNQTTSTEAVVTTAALKIGQSQYIKAIFVLNLVVVVIVVVEATRTMLWKGLCDWDYMDIKGIIVSSLNGRIKIGQRTGNEGRTVEKHVQADFRDISGKTLLRLHRETNALVVDNMRGSYARDESIGNMI